MAKLSKRHHTVPKFLLKWFTTEPTDDNPLIWRLDKATGRLLKNAVDNETVIGHFNRLENAPPGVPADVAEQDLAAIEGQCRPSLAKAILRADLNKNDLHLILMFSVFQQRRTPRARQWHTELMEHADRIAAEFDISTPGFIEHLKRERGISGEDAETLRDELLAQLRKGQLVAQSTSDEEVIGMFRATAGIVAGVAPRTRLTILHAVGAEFVLADHPVCMLDPMAPADRGVGWISPTSQVTFPIARDTCLLFGRGSPGFTHVDIKADVISDINLRSYAGAEWSIYGSAQRWVQETRTVARQQRSKVLSYAPHKPRLILFNAKEGDPKPHSVEVYEPREKVVRGFRRKDHQIHRPVPKQPMTERVLKEWSRLVPDDGEKL
jgi:hypothetical protein